MREAAALLAAGGGTHFLAGGTILVRVANTGGFPVRKMILSDGLGLDGIDVGGDTVELGAAVTMARVAAEPKLAYLKPVADSIGGPAVRNMATVGGNLFARYPYGDFAVALLALGAEVVTETANGESTGDLEVFLATRRSAGVVVRALRFKRAAGRRIPLHQGRRASIRTAPRCCRSRRCFPRRTARSPGRGSPTARWRRRRSGRPPSRRRWKGAVARRRRHRRRLQGGDGRLCARGRSAGERLVPAGGAAGASPASALRRREVVMARVPVMLTVNGREEAEFVEPGTLLVEVLRDKLELTGTRVGCSQGTCGACTVLSTAS